MRHFLIPWIIALLSNGVLGQQPQRSLTDLHNILLQGAQYRPLFERIAPLENLHVLHQAVAVSPLPEAQALNRLDILRMATPAPLFNPGQRFLTVTVPNPLYNPNFSNTDYLQNSNSQTAAIVKSIPQTISAAILNATTNGTQAIEIPNKGGFGSTSDSVEEIDKGSGSIVINKLGNRVEKIIAPKAAGPITDAPLTTEAITTTTTTTTTTTPITTTKVTTTTPLITTTVRVTQKPEHSLNLTHHLNTTNLESFLSTANISTNEAQVFIKLVEKVLEEEVAKRLHKHEEEMHKQETKKISIENESPKLAGIKLQLADVQPSIDTPEDIKFINEEYTEPSLTDKHEVKTVDTRLVYETKGIEDSYEDDVTPASTTTTAKTVINNITPTLSIRTADVIKLPRRIHSTTSLSLEQARLSSSGLKKNQPTPITDDYRAREQAEFDAIIKGGQLSSFDTEPSTPPPALRTTLPPVASTDNLINYTPRTLTHISSHQTQFERLAKDYQYRLSGQNGLNDLIKALQNAKIGFYERPTYRRYHKGGRRP